MLYGLLAMLGLFIIYSGATMISANRWIGRYNPKYTIESMDAFAKPAGVVVVVLGVLEIFICIGLWGALPILLFWIVIFALLVDAIVYIVLMKKMLVTRASTIPERNFEEAEADAEALDTKEE